jgi:hypothetical protein
MKARCSGDSGCVGWEMQPVRRKATMSEQRMSGEFNESSIECQPLHIVSR